MNVKNTKMKTAKRLGMIVGACVPFASKEWYEQEIASSTNEDENNIEIRTENLCQQEQAGRALAAHATMDKEE